MIKTDICIVGAGPSGATASLFLSKKNISHVIVDAAEFPRDKVCGDGLDLKVFRVLRHIDPEITASEVFSNQDFLDCWGVRSIAPNRKIKDFCHVPKAGEINHPTIRTSKRLHFDNFLVKRLDPKTADFRPKTKVKEVIKDGNAWRLKAQGPEGDLEIHCKLLIGADGDHSVVLRSLGDRKIDRDHYAGTLRQYWSGITGFHPKNLIEVYFVADYPMSYFYIFPLPNGEANVGYGMVSSIASKGKHNLREIFAKIIEKDPMMAPRFQNAKPMEDPIGWGLPLASKRRKAFGDGYLLLGDAASLVCPTTGEGIGTGMFSGLIAADFVEKALKTGDFSANTFANYDREVYRRLEDEIGTYHKMMNYLPFKLYNTVMNVGLSMPIFDWGFKMGIDGWMRTAYQKPIEVNV